MRADSTRPWCRSGLADLIVTCRTAYYGIRIAPSAGSVLKQLLFSFVALAVIAVALLRTSDQLHKVALD